MDKCSDISFIHSGRHDKNEISNDGIFYILQVRAHPGAMPLKIDNGIIDQNKRER